MSKKSIRRSSRPIDSRSHQTLRRSSRLLFSVRIGKVSSPQPIDGKESVDAHLGNLSKMPMKSAAKNRPTVDSHQTPLRRSARFLTPEKLKPEVSSQKSTFCRKSVEIHLGSPSISSKSTEAASYRKTRAAICRKSQLKLSMSKSGGVLEETQSGPRRSLRLTTQNGMKAFEISQGFYDGNPRRQSIRLLGVAPVSAENVKERIENPKAGNELERKKRLEVDCGVVAPRHSMERVLVTTRAGKEWNEPEAIAKSIPETVPKKDFEPMSFQIRRRSPRLTAASNGAMKREVTLEMTDKGGEVAKRLNADRGDLVLESRIEDGFVITKTAELHKEKRRKMEEGNGVENRIEKIENEEFCGTVAWSNEQEEALQKAYLMAKPSPHFWKKVSRMVPGKSAQECFDKIHTSIVTPLSPQPRSRTRKKSLSPIGNFNLSASILPHVSEIEAGRLRRCKSKRPAAALKTVRHLLRKHCITDQMKAADHFSLLESSPINIAVNVLDVQSPETSSGCTPNSLSLPQQPGEKLSANSKMFSRFELITSPDGPSPQVLKRIKNRALHDRYIDQLHHREARRVMLAKKSNFGDVANSKCCSSKPEHGALKAATTTLISEAKSFIDHFQHTLANPMQELDTDDSDDYYDADEEDIDVGDLDE